MNIIILLGLIINAHTMPVVSGLETTSRDGYVNVFVWDGGTYIYAHNYLSGSEFYDLDMGEIITAYYSDGSTKDFEVFKKDAYAFGNPADKWELRVDNQWVDIGNVVNMFSAPDDITLVTCYPDNGQTTGRFFLQLRPQEEPTYQPDSNTFQYIEDN